MDNRENGISSDNHFVSQFYLRRWQTDGLVCQYDLVVPHKNVDVWRKKSAKGIGYGKNLYTTVENDKVSDKYEKFFNEKYETPVNPIINKIIADIKLSRNDWHELINYILLQFVRTPAFWARVLESEKRTVQRYLDEHSVISQEDIGYKLVHPVTDINPMSSDMLPISVNQSSTDNLSFEVTVELGKSSALMETLNLLSEKSRVYRLFHSLKWSIGIVDKNVVLPTSDNPVSFVKVNEKGELSIAECIYKDGFVLFPISPQRFLIGKMKRENTWSMKADYTTSKNIKRLIVEGAYLYVYCSYEDPDIPTIRPRLVDKDLFNGVRNFINELHDNYITKEVPILQNRMKNDTTANDSI